VSAISEISLNAKNKFNKTIARTMNPYKTISVLSNSLISNENIKLSMIIYEELASI